MIAYDLPVNFCRQCQNEHHIRNDEPKCILTKMKECEQYGERYREEHQKPDKRPIFLYGLNYLAWKIFWRAAQLSYPGEYGSPTLTALPFVLEQQNFRLTEDEYEDLMIRILMIYGIIKEQYIAKVNAMMKQRENQWRSR